MRVGFFCVCFWFVLFLPLQVSAGGFQEHTRLRLGDSLGSQWSLASSMPRRAPLLSPLAWNEVRGRWVAFGGGTLPVSMGSPLFAATTSGLAWSELPPVLQHQRVAMSVLTGWGIASIGAGVALLFSDNAQFRDFGVQQIAWGAIDLAIAVVALAVQAGRDPLRMDLKKQQRDFRFSLWLNTGLDVLYMVAGALMMTIWGDRMAGHGAGVLVQGGFLFVFDLVNALLTHRY